MLVTRLLTAAVGIPLIVGVIWLGGPFLAAITALAVIVAALEIAQGRGAMREPLALLGALAAAVAPAAAFAGQEYLLGALILGVILLSSALTLTPDPKASLESWLWGVASVLYLGALAAHFVLLRESPDGRSWLFFTVITVWLTDTGAYFVGRAIGKHKMSPAISPGKTWEGAAGAVLAGAAAVFALDAAFDLDMTILERIVLAVALPWVVMVGDLAESGLKRALGVKDSSGLVPGHGGILDRLDSLLFAVPAVYYFLTYAVL